MFTYQDGSSERNELENRLKFYLNTVTEIPIMIGGKEFSTGNVKCLIDDIFIYK